MESKWISVKDRMPEACQPVIVHVRHTEEWRNTVLTEHPWHVVEEDVWLGDGWCNNADEDIHEVKELEYAPEWDGHTPAQAIARIGKLEPVRHGRWVERGYACGETEWECTSCGNTEWRTSASRLKWCPFCGAKMDGGKDDENA